MVSNVVKGAFFVSLIFAPVVASEPALACKGSSVVYDADFTEGWNTSENWSADSEKAKFKSPSGKVVWNYYQGDVFAEGDICVDVKGPDGVGKDPGSVAAGIALTGANKNYFFVVLADGSASIWGLASGQWIYPAGQNPRKDAAIKAGANAENNIRVVFQSKGGATMYVNDKSIVTFKNFPAANNHLIGLFVQSDGNTYEFSKLQMTEPPR